MSSGLSSAQPFHVLVKPIGPRCNLACAYCFYLDKTSLYPPRERYRMSDATLENFTRQYLEAQPPDAAEVSFAWQGGEPTLMGLPFFRRAVALQRRYARPGVRVTNALQTNGTLLHDAWGAFLHDEQFLVGLSLDGPEDLHDHWRRDRRGRGSFARVMAGLEVLRRHRVEFNTLTVIQSHNGSHPGRVYRFLKEAGSRFHQYIPIVEPEGEGRVSERSVRPGQFGDFLNGVFDEWRQADVGEVFVQHFDLLLGLAAGYPASLCVHAETCGRSLALEHNGDLYSCDHFVFPRQLLGNLAAQPLAALVDGPAQRAFGLAKRDALPTCCRSCPYRRLCHGGCPAHRLLPAPGGEPGLNYLCEGYRRFYGHTQKYFAAMTECLRRRLPASEYRRFLAPPPGSAAGKPGRNDPCPCGSGRKFKQCCGA